MTREELKAKAVSMLEMSYCPYSHFPVGAALECEDGTVYTGCNIENASYTPTVCAERTAFFKAITDGKREFTAIAVCGGKAGVIEGFFPPCGVCRQVMRPNRQALPGNFGFCTAFLLGASVLRGFPQWQCPFRGIRQWKHPFSAAAG